MREDMAMIAHKVRAEGIWRVREGTKVFLDYDEGHLCLLAPSPLSLYFALSR